jgi:hypothetical protein
MPSVLRGAGLLVLAVSLVIPAFADDQKKDAKADDKKPPAKVEDKKDDKKEKDKDAPKPEAKKDKDAPKPDPAAAESKEKRAAQDKLLSSKKAIECKLVNVEGAQRYLTVQITLKYAALNAGAANNLANLQRQLLDAARDPNPLARQRRVAETTIEIEKNKQNLYTLKEESQKLELQAGNEMKVRTLLLPVEYDDQGKVRKLSDKELRELRGPDSKLPGYAADFDSLKAEQIVDIYLGPPKGGAAKGKPKAKPKETDKDVPADESKPQVLMVVIKREPAK